MKVACLVVAFALFFSDPAAACRPHRQEISNYLLMAGNSIANVVVFQGTIASVTEKPLSREAMIREIVFQPSRWFVGKHSNSFVARVKIKLAGVRQCEFPFDYPVKKGDEWLIFGSVDESGLQIDTANSQPVENGKIPASILKELKASR